jgi:hypothetical protein
MNKGKFKIEQKTVKLSEIKPNEKNPRFIKDEKFLKLVQSLKDFPEMMSIREIVVDENMTILGGNMRFRALKEAKEVQCLVKIVSGLTDEQKQEFIIKDNVGFGDWDFDALANEWDAEKLEEWGLDVQKSDGYFQKQFENQESTDSDWQPFPITLVINEKQYNEWQRVKSKLKEESDFKVFMILFKKYVENAK